MIKNIQKSNFLISLILILSIISGLFIYLGQGIWAENLGNLIFVIFGLLVLKKFIDFLR